MPGKHFTCRVLEKIWVSSNVLRLRFSTETKLTFEPGQFVSVVVPEEEGDVKRPYSLASSPEESIENGYELCLKVVPNGIGSNYLASLRKNDEFEVCGPYGRFQYHTPEDHRNVCFIATGTGIAPIRSIVTSESFLGAPPAASLLIYGARNESEILFPKLFESLGVSTINALTAPSRDWTGFHGTVTDYLKAIPRGFSWHTTDFYLVGNPNMVKDVKELLVCVHGVSEEAIVAEGFSAAPPANAPSESSTAWTSLRRLLRA